MCVCTCTSIELSGDNILQLIKEVNKAVQNDEDIMEFNFQLN